MNIRKYLSLFPACQQSLDLLDGVDDAGNGHVMVQSNDEVRRILGDIDVHVPVAGQQVGHTVGQVGAHHVVQHPVGNGLIELCEAAGEQREGGVGDDALGAALLQVAGNLQHTLAGSDDVVGDALSGCGAGVPESKEALIEEGLKKIAESSSISGTLSQNSNINFTVAGKDINLNLNYNMDIEQMLPDGASHVKGNAELTVSGFKENTTTEMYMVPNGDNTDIYTGSKLLSDDDMTWDVYSVKNGATTSEVDPKTVIEVLNGIKNVIDKLELKEGTEKYDGNDCYVITGSYTIADLSPQTW